MSASLVGSEMCIRDSVRTCDPPLLDLLIGATLMAAIAASTRAYSGQPEVQDSEVDSSSDETSVAGRGVRAGVSSTARARRPLALRISAALAQLHTGPRDNCAYRMLCGSQMPATLGTPAC
eukprot:1558173-Alexandrium_andersonii.AAC.1